MILMTRPTRLLVAILVLLGWRASHASAAYMCSYDLDSLVLHADIVVEAEVTAVNDADYPRVCTLKVSKAYYGNVMESDKLSMECSTYVKITGQGWFGWGPFSVGDKVFAFLVKARWEKNLLDAYSPCPSGIKVLERRKVLTTARIADIRSIYNSDNFNIRVRVPTTAPSSDIQLKQERVLGMEQQMSPGPYADSLDEGELGAFRQKLIERIKWAKYFREDFAVHRGDATWLLARLEERLAEPFTLAAHPRVVDGIATDLCEAISKTKDQNTINEAAGLIREWPYSQWLGGADKPPEK